MRMNNKLQLVIKNTHPWSEHLEANGFFNFSFEEKKKKEKTVVKIYKTGAT